MAFAVIPLMVILASVEGYYRPPFTAFHRAQADLVHGSGFARSRSEHPVFNKIGSYPRYSQYTRGHKQTYTLGKSIIANQGFQRNSFNTGQRNFARGRIPSNRFTSGNIVENAKAQAESTLRILKSFEGSPIAAQYNEAISQTSDCLNNLDDFIELIQEGTNLIVENGPEITYLEALVASLEGETDIVKIIKASSKMVRTLDGLVPALAAGASNLCISSPGDSVKSFKDLSQTLANIANNRNLNVPPRSRQLLEISAEIMDQAADFLDTLNKSLEKFQTRCQSERNNQAVIYDSTREILDSLANLFKTIGFEEKAKGIKKQSEFLKKIGDSFAGLDDLSLNLECSLVGDYAALALTLDDLAVIVESIGIETLSKELGIEVDFNTI